MSKIITWFMDRWSRNRTRKVLRREWANIEQEQFQDSSTQPPASALSTSHTTTMVDTVTQVNASPIRVIDQSQSDFLTKLPPEIRLNIYENALDGEKLSSYMNKYPPLLCVSRDVRREVKPVVQRKIALNCSLRELTQAYSLAQTHKDALVLGIQNMSAAGFTRDRDPAGRFQFVQELINASDTLSHLPELRKITFPQYDRLGPLLHRMGGDEPLDAASLLPRIPASQLYYLHKDVMVLREAYANFVAREANIPELALNSRYVTGETYKS